VTWRLLLAAAILLAVGCGTGAGTGAGAPTGLRIAPDDASAHQAVQAGATGTEVTVDGQLTEEPFQSGTHEHLILRDSAGDRLEIDENTDLATPVPARQGDSVVVHGQLYVDPGPRAGIHCTHARTSRGCPDPGWIEYQGSYYE
jgi:hypothetical protein